MGGGVMKSAYGRQTPPPDYELTCVEQGSPMGELLRRYWQPMCTSDELGDLPKKVKLLCEELVVLQEGTCRSPRGAGGPAFHRSACPRKLGNVGHRHHNAA